MSRKTNGDKSLIVAAGAILQVGLGGGVKS